MQKPGGNADEAKIRLKKEECVGAMGQRLKSIDAATKDAQIELKRRSVHQAWANVDRKRCSREGCTNQVINDEKSLFVAK